MKKQRLQATHSRIERDQAHWRNLTIAQAAWQKAADTPDTTAFYLDNGQCVSFGALAEQARQLISGLQALGLQPGDTIAFQLPNWIEAVCIDIAAAALGLTVTPVVPIYRDRELRFILSDCNAKLVFIPEQFRSIHFLDMYQGLQSQLPDLQHIVVVRPECGLSDSKAITYDSLLQEGVDTGSLPVVDANQVKALLYTSGTTGFPKAVMHSHNTLCRVVDNTIDYWSLSADDTMLMASPVTHITGYASGMLFPFISEGRTALMERWDPSHAVDFIRSCNASASVGATPFLKELLDAAEQQGERLPSLRLFACGGAAVPPDLILRASEVLENCMAFRVYGSTETPVVTLGFIGKSEREAAAYSDGRIHAYDVRILDENGKAVEPGTSGEIAVCGPGMMLGYMADEQNQNAFTQDGYFLTGDIGMINADNAIVITDRKKDIIIRGGENISAKEVEDVIHQHPDIKEAAIVAAPHKRLGEGVFAYLILNSGVQKPTLETLAAFCESKKLARQKIPQAIAVIDDFPRTASGKVRKDKLRLELQDNPL
jgi:acyl-CoA synthetase (AMP-forming)/AMP-acid ligase II